MTTPTIRRSLVTTDDVSETVLRAPRRGDVLRQLRSVHPQGQRINTISDAEAAVAESARMLENISREHQSNLQRLNVLRSRQNLPVFSSNSADAPAVPGRKPRQVGAVTHLYGRVTSRGCLTAKNEIAGTLQLTSAEEIQWTASASIVDMLDLLFTGVPVEVAVALLDNGNYTLHQILPAPLSFWDSEAEYCRYAEIGPMTVMAESLVKKQLRQQHGKCQRCRQQLPKRLKCSLMDTASGPLIVCRACKQSWIDAGRPAF